jgi:site-specific DNA recombinase
MTKRNENQKRAIAYARVSTVRQAETELSLEQQMKKIRTFADLNDAEIVDEFVDRGFSGRTGERPAFRQMIEFACEPSNNIDLVIIYNFSRLFRNTASFLEYKNKLAVVGIKVVSATQDIPAGPTGDLVATMLAAVDTLFSETNALTVKDMMRANAEAGHWNGARKPFGYNVVTAAQTGSRSRKTLAIDEVEADLVRQIHRWCLMGCGSGPMGIKAIAAHLNASCVLRRGKEWATSDVARVLKLELYAGTAYFNRVDSRTRKMRPREEWIEVPVPPIISREQYGLVQEHLASRAPRKIAPRLVNSPTLLTGIATCGCCIQASDSRAGLMLRTGKSGRYSYLVCSTRATKSVLMCDAPIVRMDALDEIVIGSLEQQVFQPERLRTLLAHLVAANQNDAVGDEAEIKRLKLALVQAESGLRTLYRAAAEKADLFDLSDPVFRQEMSDMRTRRASLLGRIEAIETRRKTSMPTLTDERLTKFATDVKRRLRDGDPQFRRAWLRHFVSEVIVGHESVVLKVRKDRVAACKAEVPSFDREWRTRHDSNV